MKRLLWIPVLLLSLTLYASPKKETQADMTSAKDIFVGWIDIGLDDYWAELGYASQQDWMEVINRNNLRFQQNFRSKLMERNVEGPKNRLDPAGPGKDLQILFRDVKFDVDSYAVTASIHFIDPETGKELGSIPARKYRGGRFSVDNCINGALNKIAEKLKDELDRKPGE